MEEKRVYSMDNIIDSSDKMSTTTNSNKTKYKLAFLGNQGVGKSSIIEKYINDKFTEEANPTIGIDFLAKSVTYKSKTYRLQLWDTAGQYRFKSLIPSYLKDAICAILVYDVTNRQSLMDVENWMRLYNDNKTFEGYIVLVGNKIDLPNRKVTKEEGKRMAADLKIGYFELSAKTGENVTELFELALDNLQNTKCHALSQGTVMSIKELPQEHADTTGHNINKGRETTVELPGPTQPVSLKEPSVTTVQKKKGCC